MKSSAVNKQANPTHIKELRPDPVNRRSHGQRNLGMLVEALQQVGAARSIVIDEDGEVLAGNGVLAAAGEAGLTKLQVVEADGETIIAVRRRGLTPEQKRKLAIYDNRVAELAEWNVAQLAADLRNGEDLSAFFLTDELQELGLDGPAGGEGSGAHASLSDRFGVPPFSVLDARQGYWQDRKRAWLALGIESELGRGQEYDNGVRNETLSTIDFYAQKRALEHEAGRALTKDEAAAAMAQGNRARK